jgi:hypothetical protein
VKSRFDLGMGGEPSGDGRRTAPVEPESFLLQYLSTISFSARRLSSILDQTSITHLKDSYTTFHDASLLFRDGRGWRIALLLANRKDDALISHGGLTYGGVVTGAEATAAGMLRLFGALLDHARKAR